MIQQYLDSRGSSSQRQVLIEATIAEVTLSKTYQAGVDWSHLTFGGAGLRFAAGADSGPSAGGAAPPTGLTDRLQQQQFGNRAPTGSVQATVKLLEQFGNTRVLSSPKLMALNNQTALLKVVDNVVYFQIQSSISPATTNGWHHAGLQSVTTTPQTVAVGFIMSMTPQINDNGVVTLTVRPTITGYRNSWRILILCSRHRLTARPSPIR